MVRLYIKNVRLLGAAAGFAVALLCTGADAQTVSDELQIVLPTATFTYVANDPTSGLEPILAFANISGGTQTSDDYSTTMTSTFETNGSFNASGATAWFTSQKAGGTLREAVLTEPGSSTTYSDVMLSFMATISGTKVNAVALISDPTLVSDIMSINSALSISPATTPETGSLQNVTSLLFPTSPPFTVNVLSAVPEVSSWALLACGLALIGFVVRGRSRFDPRA